MTSINIKILNPNDEIISCYTPGKYGSIQNIHKQNEAKGVLSTDFFIDGDAGYDDLSVPQESTSLLSNQEKSKHHTSQIVIHDEELPPDDCYLSQDKKEENISIDGNASIPSEIFNLVNNIVGSGVLALPNAIAALGGSPESLLIAIPIMILVGALNAYYFNLIGRVCASTKSFSYKKAWEKSTGSCNRFFSYHGSNFVAIGCVAKALLGDLAYSMILADSFQSILVTAGFKSISRAEALILVTSVILLPLCLVENLSSLAAFSFSGIIGTIFTAAVMTLRYFDGSYSKESEKNFLLDIPSELQPVFESSEPFHLKNATILICVLATAFIAHYNAPRYYFELKNRNTIRYNVVVISSYVISIIIYILFATMGFLTFGANSNGYILQNYSTNDRLATLSRFGISISIVFTYPLLFVGVRDGILDLKQIPLEQRTSALLRKISVVILFCISLVAAFVTNLTFVLAFGGATIATLIIYVFPTLMLYGTMAQKDSKLTWRQQIEVVLSTCMMLAGIFFGVLGAIMAFQGA